MNAKQAIDLLVEEKVKKNKEQNAKFARQCELLLRSSDELLKIVTNHGRTSCSDDNIANSYEHNGTYRCVRCVLLDISQQDYNPGWYLDDKNMQLFYHVFLDENVDLIRRQIEKVAE